MWEPEQLSILPSPLKMVNKLGGTVTWGGGGGGLGINFSKNGGGRRDKRRGVGGGILGKRGWGAKWGGG